MTPEKAAEHLKVIRQLMERPIRCSTQSGLSGVFAGCVALLGVWADYTLCETVGLGAKVFWINSVVWTAVFFVALGGTLLLTRLREVRMGMPFWTPAKRRVIATVLPYFVLCVGLTWSIMYHRFILKDHVNQYGLIAPLQMAFYGLACWSVGRYTIPEIRVMGAAFILAAIVTAFFCQYRVFGFVPYDIVAPYWTLGVTFGGFHIIYGIVVWIRHGG